MSWTKYEEKATAIHPFTPAQDEHLKVLTGDRLEITEKNGRWVKCKNLETSCVGICPIQCLQIASQNPQDNFSLLGVEVQYLFDYIFKTYFPTKSPNENDMHILDLVKKVQSCYPPTESTRVQLALSIDDLRSALGLTQFQRDQFGNVITTHTTTKSLFSSDSSKDINKTKSAYTSQLEVTLSFTYTFNTELRLCFRLYDKQKNEVLSAPADIFLPANCEEKQTLKFINIEKNNFSSTAIVCRAFGITKPGEGIPDLYEYKGIAASMLQPPKDFHTSADQHLQLQFHSMNEISQIDSVDAILNSTFGENDISPLSVQVNFLEYIDKAKNVTESNVIPTLSIPQNISTSLDANYTYVRIHLLHHKTKLKKTRVVLRVLDIEKKEYINCFEHTSDPSVFPSVVQKGSTDMKIDEIAAIKLDKNSDLSKWIMIFEVQRPNKGQVHLSSYAIESLLNNDNTLNESKDKKLTLNKPTAQVMTPEDYINQFINTKTKSTGTGGDLNISITSVSTDFTKNPTIYKILHWKDHVQELEEDNVETPKDIEQVTLSIFMNRIFINLAEMMISKNPKLEQFSTNFFVKTLYEIDQSKSQLFKSFFDGFIETQFNPNNTVLSNLHTLFMKYIADALPSSSDNKNNNNGDEYSLGDCKICCRCLFHILSIISASLKMNTEIKNENQFKESVKIIFQRLGILMSIEDKTMIVFKSFVARSFPMLCDIALGYFQQNERIKLVIDFFNANAFKSDTNDDIVKQTRANKLRLISGSVEAQFFSEEINRKQLLPMIIKDLIELNQGNFQQFIFPIIQNIFFLLKSTSSCFQNAITPLAHFLEDIIQNKEDFNFLILFLYFSKLNIIKNTILKSKDKITTYNSLLNIVLTVVKSNPPTYLFYVCSTVFTNLISFSQMPEFDFVQSTLDKLIEIIAAFFNEFLRFNMSLDKCDQNFFQQIYCPNLGPIASILPKLMKSMSRSKFSSDVFLPLFHFYINQEDSQTRSSVIDSFQLILENDYNDRRNFSRSVNACIHAMDAISNSENEKLLDLITLFDQTKPKVKKQGSDLFFNNLNLFAQYIYDLGRYPNQRQYEDERTTAIISVLNSCRNNNDFQLFPHFASKLYELHINLGNKVEAAEALIECSKILKWDDREHVSEGHGFPEQEKRERKRLILHKAVELYIESEFYEKALEVLEELLKYYQDYEENQIKISEVYELESKCYDLICNQERNILNRFYGVKFYGSKFDTYFKDKTFVYRRNGFFMNDQMMRDLKDKFPEAKVDPKPPSDEDLKDPNLYYIYVFNLKPKDLDNFDCYMPQSTLMVKSCCNIQEFYSETPIRIKREGNYGEFAEWHRNVITYNTEMPLQGIARRSTVIKTSPVKVMSPIECAIYDTNQKTLELMQKACMYWRCIRFKLKFNAVAVSSFSMLQNGIVNAAVNGGTKIFQELFLESDLRLEKINQLNAQKLKDAFADQLKAVNFALQVHYIVKSAQYNELHQNIVENFEEMKKQMEKAIGTINLTERATMFEIPPTDFFEAPLDKGE